MRKQHCLPPHYRPAQTQRGSIRCTKERYRSRTSTAHPDKSNSDAEIVELNQAREEALRELEK